MNEVSEEGYISLASMETYITQSFGDSRFLVVRLGNPTLERIQMIIFRT